MANDMCPFDKLRCRCLNDKYRFLQGSFLSSSPFYFGETYFIFFIKSYHSVWFRSHLKAILSFVFLLPPSTFDLMLLQFYLNILNKTITRFLFIMAHDSSGMRLFSQRHLFILATGNYIRPVKESKDRLNSGCSFHSLLVLDLSSGGHII